MLSDVEIAQNATPEPIVEIAGKLGLSPSDLLPYGNFKAKVSLNIMKRLEGRPPGKLILVTAITPTPAGEGKTTVTVGLGDALHQLGKNACIAIREPSFGPCFGIKGGAAGGGWAQVIPMEEINLHFTGDFHAVTMAHNLLSAMTDNHLQHGNQLGMDSRTIQWKRVLDVNDRALRNIVIGLGGKSSGVPRESGFDITAASEIMATLCLSNNLMDLRERLGRIIVGFKKDGTPATAADLCANGAMTAVLKDALLPNLVQTLEGTPAFVHGGSFGNMGLADYVVTEAGFGSDLGAEKFMDIVCPAAGVRPDATVIVATVRALKMHGGVPKTDLSKEDIPALGRGVPNLLKHCENMRLYGPPIVICINRFSSDTQTEVDYLLSRCKEQGLPVAVSDVWEKGGVGGLDLARIVLDAASNPGEFHPLYNPGKPVKEKIECIATNIYGASRIIFTDEADKNIEQLERLGFGGLPICMAKTQYSLSDDPSLLGRPEGFKITVKDIKVSAGAGFIVAYTGRIMTMPGLPKSPAAEHIDVDSTGIITGLS